MTKFVKENEPKTLKYQLQREINKKTGVDNLIMLERCVSAHALFLFVCSLVSKKPSSVDFLSSSNLTVNGSYTDMAAIKAHGSSKEYKQLQKTIQAEDLVAAPTKVVFLEAVSGFGSRL